MTQDSRFHVSSLFNITPLAVKCKTEDWCCVSIGWLVDIGCNSGHTVRWSSQISDSRNFIPGCLWSQDRDISQSRSSLTWRRTTVLEPRPPWDITTFILRWSSFMWDSPKSQCIPEDVNWVCMGCVWRLTTSLKMTKKKKSDVELQRSEFTRPLSPLFISAWGFQDFFLKLCTVSPAIIKAPNHFMLKPQTIPTERVNNFINIHNSSSVKMLNDLIKILHTKLNDKVETNSS